MSAIVTAVIALLGQLVPLIGSNSTLIASIINTLIAILPEIVNEVETLIPPIKNIIAALSADPATTAEQMATLQALDAQCDQAFESAAVDPAADAAG
jgi:sensor domain CHASE-containing protein